MQVSLLLSEPEPVPSLRGAVTSPALGVFPHQHRDLRSLLWSLMGVGVGEWGGVVGDVLLAGSCSYGLGRWEMPFQLWQHTLGWARGMGKFWGWKAALMEEILC